MVASTKTPLGASTTSRKWYLDVDLNDGVGTPNWVGVMGITNLVPNPDNPTLEDDSDYDSGGFGSQTKTGASWSLAATVKRAVLPSDGTSYDPGQEHLRTRSIGQFGPSNTVYVRIYEMTPGGPRVEAYTGHGAVSWQPQGGAMTALDTVQVAISGQGQLALISHPDTGSAVPTVGAVQVAGATALTIPAAGGATVRLTGTKFTGTTGITFIGTNAPSFIVASDGVIQVTAPAHAAGSGTLVVTNGAGASTGYAITYV